MSDSSGNIWKPSSHVKASYLRGPYPFSAPYCLLGEKMLGELQILFRLAGNLPQRLATRSAKPARRSRKVR